MLNYDRLWENKKLLDKNLGTTYGCDAPAE